MTAPVERPEWLVPGAEVVTWYPYSQSGAGVKAGKVKSVAAQSFVLEDEREPRYKIKDMAASTGSGWDRTTKYVAQADSPEGVYWLADRDVNDCRQRADVATLAWQKERTVHTARELQHVLSLWIAGTEYLATLERPARR